MNTQSFQQLLLKSAVSVIGCDGKIVDEEIAEIRAMAENEIYFMGIDFEEVLSVNIDYLKKKGRVAINEYLNELGNSGLNENQEMLLIEVLLRAIEFDKKIESNEIKFLQLVKSKLQISEEALITKFPEKMNYLVDVNNYGTQQEFKEEIQIT